MNDSTGHFLSVLVATHNQACYLTQCLNSLLDQTMPRAAYQLVIVDDGSTDGTPDVILNFTQDIDVVVTHPHNMGLAQACNSGLQKVTGQWIVRVDSDDWLHSTALEQLRSPSTNQ